MVEMLVKRLLVPVSTFLYFFTSAYWRFIILVSKWGDTDKVFSFLRKIQFSQSILSASFFFKMKLRDLFCLISFEVSIIFVVEALLFKKEFLPESRSVALMLPLTRLMALLSGSFSFQSFPPKISYSLICPSYYFNRKPGLVFLVCFLAKLLPLTEMLIPLEVLSLENSDIDSACIVFISDVYPNGISYQMLLIPPLIDGQKVVRGDSEEGLLFSQEYVYNPIGTPSLPVVLITY